MSLTKDIESLLPHRKPFLFVDEIISADEKGSVSEHTFTEDEFFFKGHFPGNIIKNLVFKKTSDHFFIIYAKCGNTIVFFM